MLSTTTHEPLAAVWLSVSLGPANQFPFCQPQHQEHHALFVPRLIINHSMNLCTTNCQCYTIYNATNDMTWYGWSPKGVVHYFHWMCICTWYISFAPGKPLNDVWSWKFLILFCASDKTSKTNGNAFMMTA